jgi:acyl-CoA dehydrogenase
MWHDLLAMGIADGPTEVHRAAVAKAVLKDAEPYEGLFPPEHIPTRLTQARSKYADLIGAAEGAAK